MTLHLFDTATRAKRPFVPLQAGQVSMYVCGLTVYDLPHIGHARTFLVFDVVRRYLIARGFNVTFIRNHTDIDDKIIRRANASAIPPSQLAESMIEGLDHDMHRFGVLAADAAPKVTEHIPEIIAMVQTLIEKGYAYNVDGDVYYRVRSFDSYGSFSGRNLDDLRSGDRVAVDTRKEDPLDFALWKSAKPDEPFWDSPWGKGRPGWHIECSAMSTKHFGASFDIHGGGRDLIFPHHENEIAQSVGALGGDFARYWMHVGMLEIHGEKMSHSLDNFWTLRDILERVHPEALRYFFLTAHYRNNINYSLETISEATHRIAYLYRTLETLETAIARRPDAALIDADGPREHDEEITALLADFFTAMDDDINTPRALAQIAEAARLANELAEKKKKPTDPRLRAMLSLRQTLLTMGETVGLFSRAPEQALKEISDLKIAERGLDVAHVDQLVRERDAARVEKNWAEADRIRDELAGLGVMLLDRPEGTDWRVE